MASSSSSSSRSYPVFPQTLDEVSADPAVFFKTLVQRHKHMGTTFRIPWVAGQDLDFHRLFLAVTSRGGIDKVRSEKRLKEVADSLEFPSPTKNTPSKLGEHYSSYLYHYEQIFFFKALEWKPSATSASSLGTSASAGMRGVGAENLSKEKEGNDDGDQHAQKMDES